MEQENNATFGICERCGSHLMPVIFTKNYCVDGSFDGPWHN